jgi:hypothetical protein
MRSHRLLALALLAATAGAGPARAGLVTVVYSGSVSEPGGPYATGTAFNGSFTYDSAAAAFGGGSNFADFPATSFTLDIGGDSLSSLSPAVEVDAFGRFIANGFALQGTGPFAGGEVDLLFFDSSDPAFPLLQLPVSFPGDFTSTDVGYFIDLNTHGGFGPLTAFAQVSAPEPASLTLLAVGAAGLAGYTWRRRAA